ncbi:MAG: hypothetical protein FWC16_00565 [Defluviitaleaceae bacterium]|nr:hypothetical protein [Defluviitaleaceae bacterium]MCL2273396.1 hypothetical protein [Defluviitaleaceae bacterium]
MQPVKVFPTTMLKNEFPDIHHDAVLMGDVLREKYVCPLDEVASNALEFMVISSKKKKSNALLNLRRIYITTGIFEFSLVAAVADEHLFANLMTDANRYKSSFNADSEMPLDKFPHIWLFNGRKLKAHSYIPAKFALNLVNGLANLNYVDVSLLLSRLSIDPRELQ